MALAGVAVQAEIEAVWRSWRSDCRIPKVSLTWLRNEIERTRDRGYALS